MDTPDPARRWNIKTSGDLGRVVRGARQLNSMTQAELAEQTDIGRTYLVRIEGGATTILLDRVLKTFRTLGIDLIAVERQDG